jgi:hypothetical protein
MSAKVIDISGRMIDEGIRSDLAILCRDIEIVNAQGAHWAEIEEKLSLMIATLMRTAGINHFETETLFVQLDDDELVLEGKGSVQ